MKSHILRTSVFVCSLIMLTISISYSFYNIGVTKVNNVDESVVYVGNMMINFETSSYINNTAMLPVSDADIATKADHTDFVVSHAAGSTIGAYYFVSLIDLAISDNFKNSSDFRWALLKDGTEVVSGDFTGLGTETTLLLTNEPILLETTDVHNLVLRIWIRETSVDQSSLFDGSFSGKVQVSARV